MKSKFLELFGLAAKDRSPEEIARMAQDASSVMDEGTPSDSSAKDEKEESSADGDNKKKSFESVDDEALDGLLEKLMARKAAREAAAGEAHKDPMDTAIDQLTGGGPADSESAQVVPAEEMDKGTGCGGMDKALAAGILKAMRPSVAAIKDEKQRNAVADALIKIVTAKDSESDIAKIMQAAQNNAQKTADSNLQADYDKIQALYDARNPHKAKKEDK